MFRKMLRGNASLSPAGATELHHGSSAAESYGLFGLDGYQALVEKILSNLIVALAIFFVSFFFTLSILDFVL